MSMNPNHAPSVFHPDSLPPYETRMVCALLDARTQAMRYGGVSEQYLFYLCARRFVLYNDLLVPLLREFVIVNQ